MKVALFVPCYIDAVFPEVGIATLELLERLGCSVEYPADQTCCGQPMANSGCQEDAAATEAWRASVHAATWSSIAGNTAGLAIQVAFIAVLSVGGLRVARLDRHVRGPGLQHAQLQHDHVRDAIHGNGHRMAAADASRQEKACQAV